MFTPYGDWLSKRYSKTTMLDPRLDVGRTLAVTGV